MPPPRPVVLPADLPAGLAVVRERGPEWSRWFDALPRLATALVEEWGLSLDGAALHGHTALVLPVRDDDGRALVLKLTRAWRTGIDDGAGEIPALKAWAGRGAVRLERADPRRGALLLERLGAHDVSTLWDHEAAEVVGGLYRHLHVPAPPTVPGLAPSVLRWLDDLESFGRDVPAPPRFVAQALRSGRDLVADGVSGGRVIHGDLHYGNVLLGGREGRAGRPDGAGWLAIDPKGFAGDPCYEPAPMLWNRWDDLTSTGDVGNAVRYRFWGLVDAGELDETRCRDWVVVRAMIGVSWELADARAAGTGLGPASREAITRCVTVAKAMQAVGGSW